MIRRVSRLRNPLSVANEELNYKRIEDQKWRESVSTRLVSLTDSEVTQNDRLDDIEEEIHALKEMLEGKATDKNDNGVKGDIHDLSRHVNELHALMMPDHLGQGGIIARIKALEKKAGIEQSESDNRWKFRTAIAVAIVGLVTAFITNLDKIEPSFRRFFSVPGSTTSSSSKKHTAKTSKRRPKPAVMEAPTEATDDGAGKEEMPDGRSGNDGDSK